MSTVAGGVTFCAACGTALEPEAVFCGTCGARVAAAAAPDSAPAPEAPHAGAHAASAADAAPAGSGAPHPAAGAPARIVAGPAAPPPAVTAAPTWSLGADVDDAVAPVWRRLVALLVDQLLAVLVGGAGLLVVLGAVRDDGSVGALLVPGLLLLLLGAGQWIGEAIAGRTVGGALLGIRTVSVRTGRPAGLWAVLVRSVVQGLGVLVGGIGVYVVAGSGAWDEGPEQRGWHDKAAGTLVLRARPVDRSAAEAASGDGAAVRVPAAGPASAPPAAAPASGPTSGPPPAAVPDPQTPATPAVVPTSGPPAAGAPLAAAPSGSATAAPAPSMAPSAAAPLAAGPAAPLAADPPMAASAAAPTAAPAAPAPERDTPDDLPDATVPGLGDLEHTHVGRWAAGPEAAGPATGLVLVVDTGDRVVVTGAGLIGRRPVPGDETWAHLVAIDDPTQSVSSTHLAFWPAEAGLDVLDRGSTNGTVLLDPAGKPWSLTPGAPARVAAGWTLVLGNRRVRVDPA
jgi:uncharacterized RDD family membrane protein YckC